ncbi:MAG: hypothetical protein K8T89_11340 [Planctomycetes bacterium]|nr:hypothetical protein [Planctomycetota bacterium]
MPRTQTAIAEAETSEIAILGRVLGNGRGVSQALARHLLELRFSEEDNARINDLAARNQEGSLSRSEQDELRNFANAGCLLGILHAKARRALRKSARK